MDPQVSRPRPLHIVQAFVQLNVEIDDVVSSEAGRQALHSIKAPRGFEDVISWDVRPVKGTKLVVFTPVFLDSIDPV